MAIIRRVFGGGKFDRKIAHKFARGRDEYEIRGACLRIVRAADH